MDIVFQVKIIDNIHSGRSYADHGFSYEAKEKKRFEATQKKKKKIRKYMHI